MAKRLKNCDLTNAEKAEKNALVLIGATGKGKSTYGNFLCGCDLKQDDNANIILADPKDELFKICLTNESETEIPKMESLLEINWSFGIVLDFLTQMKMTCSICRKCF